MLSFAIVSSTALLYPKWLLGLSTDALYKRVAVHHRSFNQPEEHLPPPLAGLPDEQVEHGELFSDVHSIHTVVVCVYHRWFIHRVTTCVNGDRGSTAPCGQHEEGLLLSLCLPHHRQHLSVAICPSRKARTSPAPIQKALLRSSAGSPILFFMMVPVKRVPWERSSLVSGILL